MVRDAGLVVTAVPALREFEQPERSAPGAGPRRAKSTSCGARHGSWSFPSVDHALGGTRGAAADLLELCERASKRAFASLRVVAWGRSSQHHATLGDRPARRSSSVGISSPASTRCSLHRRRQIRAIPRTSLLSSRRRPKLSSLSCRDRTPNCPGRGCGRRLRAAVEATGYAASVARDLHDQVRAARPLGRRRAVVH